MEKPKNLKYRGGRIVTDFYLNNGTNRTERTERTERNERTGRTKQNEMNGHNERDT